MSVFPSGLDRLRLGGSGAGLGQCAVAYRVMLQFEEGGPAVTGDWASGATALRTYRAWVGLYGGGPTVVIRLIEEADGRRREVRTWTAQGETETPQGPDGRGG
ncbi:hypothetical protein SBI_09342 [Streptomyces bingchenggensis BCW-1]|uniref:Uncharacterized protein n=1 Tax=Streptomyces bingchenggensis (strain BCW-1) TaxID=749414 RepID=D7C5T1_STRBB|nr:MULTISPECIES: hypothetical protein [Streptomyces]ADI12460.1 hypothetical protein SBI_09342 [Streptomyces bingchenggensis BCW-1]